MRTLEEIKADVDISFSKDDAPTLMHLAGELDELATPEATALTHDVRGWACLCTGDYPTALEHYNVAIAIYQELGNRIGVASITGNVGSVYYSTGDYPAALEHFNTALALYQELGNRSGVASVTGNIGIVYSSTGNYPAALEHYNSVLAMCHEFGDGSGVAGATANIFHALLCTDDVEGARQTLAALDELHIDNPRLAVHREVGRAELHVLDGDFQAAQTTLANALDLARTHGLRSDQADLFKELRDLAQKRNDFAAYIEHNNEFTRINEEIRGKETSIKLAIQAKEREIAEREKETAKHMAVLHSTLPKHIADRVARGEVVNDHYDNAAVLFLDIVGFTYISDRIPAGHVVHLLDQIFTALDALCEQHDVTKIKTIGDSYMAVGFEGNTTERMALCALDMLSTLNDMEIKMPAELGDTSWTNDVGDIRVRIGLHVGPVTAGVIGTQRMQYDVWGDTVNVASRMENSSEAGRIHVSEAFAINLKSNTEYRIQNTMVESENTESLDSSLVTSHFTSHSSLVTLLRGSVDVKGKGLMTTYWLEQA